jgi:thiol:disulfide interchange protein DsbG
MPQPDSAPATRLDEIPALRTIRASGAQLTDLGTSHGMRTVFARSGQHFQVFYITPDQQAVVGGVEWDGDGNNVTRKQVEVIEGVIPTVTLGLVDPKPGRNGVADAFATLKEVENTTYGLTGKDGAPRLFMLFDPQCSFSVRAMQQLQPFVAQGKVQLALIPVSILDHEDAGQSTKAALSLLSQPSIEMAAAWAAGKAGPAAPDAGGKLARNMAAAEQVHLRGTPTFIWRNRDGSEGRLDGIPDDFGALIAKVGS